MSTPSDGWKGGRSLGGDFQSVCVGPTSSKKGPGDIRHQDFGARDAEQLNPLILPAGAEPSAVSKWAILEGRA